MPFAKIMIHLVWSTKNRMPVLRNEIRPQLLNHLRSNAITKGISIDFLNCHLDHVHCLISLSVDQNISQVVKLLKGESSHWINVEKLVPGKFAWQDEYFAVSVSESKVQIVQEYIRNQEAHHRKKSYQDEYEEFLRILNNKKLD